MNLLPCCPLTRSGVGARRPSFIARPRPRLAPVRGKELQSLFGHGPAPLTTWTSSYSETGVLGAADLASAEKGKAVIDEAAQQLARLVQEFAARPKHQRVDHHRIEPTMALPWEQAPET